MSKVIENYILKEAVGSGQYGKVFKSNHAVTGAVYAVKAIKSEKFKNVPKLQEFTNNEISTLTKLVNPNVIAFVEMLRTANNVYLIYEFCNGGTLEDVIKKNKFLQEQEALVVFSQIINAFRSLFNNNILHRDLKPSNILLHDGVIKVADFGFCKTLLSPSDLTQTMVGSPIYMAPEILKGCNYNIKADIWSMGVVLFEMLFGYCPFEDKTIARLIAQIDSKPLSIPRHINNISPKVEELLHKMLTVDPNKRIEWNALLNYPLFERAPLQDKTSLASNQAASSNPLMPPQVSQQQFFNQQPISPYVPLTSQNGIGQIQPSILLTYQQQQQQPQLDQQQQQIIEASKQNIVIQKLLEIRSQIIYQIQTLSSLIETNNESDSYVTLELILLKNASNQADYLQTQLNQQQQIQSSLIPMTSDKSKNTSTINGDNQKDFLNQVFSFVQREVQSLQSCLKSFKKEVERVFLQSIQYSGNNSNSFLKKEHNMVGIDFQGFKQTVLSYVDSVMLAASNSPSIPTLTQAQLANQILNCFLLEEYFSNKIEIAYNDLNNSSKTSDLSSLLSIITHKTEIVKMKLKPQEKYYIYY